MQREATRGMAKHGDTSHHIYIIWTHLSTLIMKEFCIKSPKWLNVDSSMKDEEAIFT